MRRRTTLPMVLDEVITDAAALLRAFHAGGMEAINLKISKVGGLTRARQMRELAETLGLRLTIEDTWGGDLVTAAVSHLAASVRPEALFTVSFMNDWTNEHIAGYQPRSRRRSGPRRAGPGLGVDVDLEHARRAALQLRRLRRVELAPAAGSSGTRSVRAQSRRVPAWRRERAHQHGEQQPRVERVQVRQPEGSQPAPPAGGGARSPGSPARSSRSPGCTPRAHLDRRDDRREAEDEQRDRAAPVPRPPSPARPASGGRRPRRAAPAVQTARATWRRAGRRPAGCPAPSACAGAAAVAAWGRPAARPRHASPGAISSLRRAGAARGPDPPSAGCATGPAPRRCASSAARRLNCPLPPIPAVPQALRPAW